MLAVDPIEARWTLADVAYEGVTPVGFTDLTYSSVVAWVWMAGPWLNKTKETSGQRHRSAERVSFWHYHDNARSCRAGYAQIASLPQCGTCPCAVYPLKDCG